MVIKNVNNRNLVEREKHPENSFGAPLLRTFANQNIPDLDRQNEKRKEPNDFTHVCWSIQTWSFGVASASPPKGSWYRRVCWSHHFQAKLLRPRAFCFRKLWEHFFGFACFRLKIWSIRRRICWLSILWEILTGKYESSTSKRRNRNYRKRADHFSREEDQRRSSFEGDNMNWQGRWKDDPSGRAMLWISIHAQLICDIEYWFDGDRQFFKKSMDGKPRYGDEQVASG